MTTDPSSLDAARFDSLGLLKPILTSLTALGYEEPTPIQRQAIPTLIAGRDLIGQAGTGTGKTAAFALPLLHRLASAPGKQRGTARALILVPTRELAMQVAEAIHKYGKGLNLTVAPLYGGAPMDHQIRALRRGAEVVVATPGRAQDHLRRGTLDLSQLEVLVLDEADEMLDMGFAEDIDAIIATTPDTRQTALFAATWAPRIAAIAGRHLKDAERVTIPREKRAAGKLPRIRQVAYMVPRERKTTALGTVLDFETPGSTIVFCRTRLDVDQLTDVLNAHGYTARALHGGMVQVQRDRVMQQFRKEQVEILVATDVAARGLDIDHVSHVINYDVPVEPEVYVHRIGRTGRIGRDGVAITLVDPREHRFMRNIESLTKQKVEILKLPTLADLHAKKLESTREALRAELAKGNLEDARSVVQSLLQDFDALDVAAAAVRLLHDAPERGATPEPADQPAASADATPEVPSARDERARGRLAVISVSVGKRDGVGPGDLVGAITGEAHVPSSAIGAIDVAFTQSLIEIPESIVDRVAVALRRTNIRGKKVVVTRENPDDLRHQRPKRDARPRGERKFFEREGHGRKPPRHDAPRERGHGRAADRPRKRRER